eukprot:m.75214 g.75214  ORF g.75214 m.75214 type:complete len:155 (+) comp12439_c1_seq1:161-625(+)
MTSSDVEWASAQVKNALYPLAAFFVVYYAFLLNQSITSKLLVVKYKKDGKKFSKYYNKEEPQQLCADRTVGNMMEQMFPFLTFFLLNIFVCVLKSVDNNMVVLGAWVYTAARVMYFFVFRSGGTVAGVKPLVYLATAPAYLVIAFYAYNLFAIL